MPVFLLSGGLDSVVLLHWGVRQPHLLGIDPNADDHYQHVAVHFRTGIQLDDRLSEICRQHCHQLQVELVEIDLSHVWKPGSRARGEAPLDAESPIMTAVCPADDPYWSEHFDYQDGRGLLFLTYCGIEASNRGINTVLVAFQHEEDEVPIELAAKNPMVSDAGAEFLQAFDLAANNGGFLPSRVPWFYAPFEHSGMAKRHIIELGWSLGVDLDATLSCEFSDPPCGKCMGCTRRARAFEQARFVRRIREEHDVHASIPHLSRSL
jgi:7-cyano-7-deazaguanine synthase in queuosine biosynthesis